MLYKTLWFTGFAGPAAICFVLVMLIPFIYGMYLTLTDWNGISAEKVFVGVENYKAIFRDGPFWHSLVLTVAYSAVSVILINFMAFVLAYLVTSGVKGQNFFRAGFFTPNLIGGLVLGPNGNYYTGEIQNPPNLPWGRCRRWMGIQKAM